MEKSNDWRHSLLPLEAQGILMTAASTAAAMDEESVERRIVIEDAIRRVRALWPEAFR